MALPPAQTDAAIDYNKRQGYCDHEIMLTQRTVGAVEDGIWGPETVNKVAVWQPTRGLTADGKVGPQTWAEVKASWELVPTDPPPPDQAEVGCGLAAYDQTWPGRSPDEALDKAFDQAIAEGAKELRFWSSEWLDDEHGNKGNSYSGPWLAAKTIPAGVKVGAWIDDPVSSAKKESFAQALVQRQVSIAALMINRSNTRPDDVPWRLRWSEDDLRAVADLYHAHGIEIVCTTWPRPSKSQIDAMLTDMAWILPTCHSKTFEVDTEGNWASKYLDGFPTMRAAAEYLRDGMRSLVGDDGTLELTTFTYHVENSKNAILAPMMDRLLPQAYSVRHRGNETIEWDDSLGPGKHQTLAMNRARQAAAALTV